MSNSLTYADSGVDIDKANQLVGRIKDIAKTTPRSGVMGEIGGFGGLFSLNLSNVANPVLVSSTDWVGTKLKIAFMMDKHDTLGIDLVAMCVNDIIVGGAEPLFFLDYFATGKLEVEKATEVVKGIADGCKQSGAALVGGETAEMPGMYSENDFDLAGFAVGITEEDEMDRISHTKAGDVLIALPSSGVHSNGFSLVRKILEANNMDVNSEFNGKPMYETLLTPTRIYVKEFKKLKNKINALAHITGGGIIENLPRVLPDNLKAVVEKDKVQVLPIFELMGEHVEESEMYRAFNMGVGMIFVVNPLQVDEVLGKTDGYIIGEITSGEKGCDLV